MKTKVLLTAFTVLTLFFLTSLSTYGNKANLKTKSNPKITTFEIVPGKSIGPVFLGQTRAELKATGFYPDPDRTSQNDIDNPKYLSNENVIVLLDAEMVVQIWIKKEKLNLVRFKGKMLPKKIQPTQIKSFFKNCTKEIKGSGGFLIYCQNNGIELAFSYHNDFQSLSVTNPENFKN